MLNWIKWAIVIGVISALATFHFVSLRNAKKAVEDKWIVEQIKKDAEYVKLNSQIVQSALELEKEKNEEINKLNASVASLNDRLRNRPSRETIVYRDAPRIEQACTGAELYREDGEFLAGEAARAERVRIERDYYYSQYEQARKKLNESN